MAGRAVLIQSAGPCIVMLQHEVMAVMDGVTVDLRISSQYLCIHININEMLLCSLFIGYSCRIHAVCQCAWYSEIRESLGKRNHRLLQMVCVEILVVSGVHVAGLRLISQLKKLGVEFLCWSGFMWSKAA